jgi:tRNA (guanine-N7-)-methyltransferase
MTPSNPYQGRSLKLNLTRTLPNPDLNPYVKLMSGEFAKWALTEEQAPLCKGRWREQVFELAQSIPLDLEIGTGNGYHFAQLAQANDSQRALLGLELKYKPLVQSIRRAVRKKAQNVRIARYDAGLVAHLFEAGEINNVYIHFPDPWEKKRQNKNRLIQDDFLTTLFDLQRPGSFLDFKTDSREYFDWALEKFAKSPYEISAQTFDLHHSQWKEQNFVTHFESLFLEQGLPIHYARLTR